MIQYFGTDLDSLGHYFWQLDGNAIYRGRMTFSNCPFNPEALPYWKQQQVFKNGDTQFYQFAGFSIYAIEGSCADKRPASKSIFFVEQELEKGQMKALITSVPIANKIIQKMPFDLEW